MDPISLEELALLDVLQRIDQGQPLTRHSRALHDRLISAALVEAGLIVPGEEPSLQLTDAGVERCKSLRHRVAADTEALQVLREREDSGAPSPAQTDVARGGLSQIGRGDDADSVTIDLSQAG